MSAEAQSPNRSAQVAEATSSLGQLRAQVRPADRHRVVALVIWLLFLIGSPRTFLSYPIYNAFMSSTPYFALMAIPLTLVIIAGEIDCPSLRSWPGAWRFRRGLRLTESVFLAFIACLAAGAVRRLLNGLIVDEGRHPVPGGHHRHAVLLARRGDGHDAAATGSRWCRQRAAPIDLTARPAGSSADPGAVHLDDHHRHPGLVPAQPHRFGAHVYLTGDNVDSARLMGVDVDRVKISASPLSGLAPPLPAWCRAWSLYFWPTVGEGQLLNTLASVFLGGTSVFGGTGTIFGTFVARTSSAPSTPASWPPA